MKIFTLTALIILLSGCVNTQQRQNQVAVFKSTIPTCHSEKECEYKWSAARKWVIENAGMKLQHVEDDFLETYNSGSNSVALAVRVMKEPIATGYKITVSASCRNLFGCHPDAMESMLHFNRTVNATYIPNMEKQEKVKQEKPKERSYGKHSVAAERQAIADGCVGQGGVRPVGDMIIDDAGTETYQFHCATQTLLVRCELGSCKTL